MKKLSVTGRARLSFIVASLLATSCTAVSEKHLLLFPVQKVQDCFRAEEMAVDKVFPGSFDLTGFAVLNDKLVVTARYGSDYCLDVVDVTSGEVLYGACRIGRGPGEFLGLSPLFSTTNESVVVYDLGTGILSEVSIDGSMTDRVIHQVKLEASSGQSIPIILSSHIVREKEILAFNSIQAPSEYVSIATPYYAVYDYETGSEKRTICPFDATPLAHSSEWVTMTAFDLRDCVNSENTSICFVMGKMPVFGFIDIASGKVRGFRLNGEPAFSTSENRLYFTGICARDQFIYALYLGTTEGELDPERSKTFLYKLDWDGHILKKYELDGVYRGCYATSNELYLSKAESDLSWGLYQVDIKML